MLIDKAVNSLFFLIILSFLFSIIPILINVAFITLFERKILGLSQLRKGPNKIGVAGLPQPFNDAIKLFRKEVITPSKRNFLIFFIGPGVAISLSLSA
jgi:NADH:ubiquinone oxidoreductase subunit H